MLLAEYDYETDIAVQRAEEHEIAFAEGIEQGIEQGSSEGSYQTKLETALKLIKNRAILYSDDRKTLKKHRQKLQPFSAKKCKKFCERT